MKPPFQTNPFLRVSILTHSKLIHAAGFGVTLCVAVMSPSARAASQTWDGGVDGTGTTLQTTTNWSGDTTAPTSGETATFSDTNGTSGNLSLTYDNTFTGGSNGVSLSMAGLHTGSLAIDPGTSTTALRLKNLTIDSGAGAFTFGNGNAEVLNLTLGSGNAGFTTNAFTNNSSNTAILKSDVKFGSGGAVQSRALTFDGSGNWQVDTVLKPSQTIGGAITTNAAGSFTLIKKGTGSLALNATNTGNNAINDTTGLRSVTIEQGTILAGANGALGGLGNTAGAGAVTLGLSGSNSANLLNTGAFTQANAITVASGNTGTLTLGGNHITGTSVYSGAITLNSNVILSAATGGQVNFTGAIGGNGNTTVTGGGMVAISGSNNYAGTTTIESGVLRATGASALGGSVSPIALGNATSINSNLNATLRINGATTLARDVTVGAGNSATTGTYTIDTDNASSAVSLSGVVTLNQNLTVSGTTSGGFTLSGNITSGSSTARTVTFAGNANGVLVASGVIGGGTGGIAVAKSGAATLTLSGTNSYTGGTTVNGGIITAQNNNAFGTTGVVNQAAGGRNSGIQLQGGITLPDTVTFVTSNDGTSGATVPYAINNLSGNNTVNGTISITTGGGGSVIQSDSGALTLAGNITIAAGQTSRGIILQGASTSGNTISGVVSDLSPTSTNSITKKGAGTWALTGANTYTGSTTVSAGTLFINGSLGDTAVTVDGGTFGGTGTVGGSVTVGAATFAPGASPGSLEIAGDLTLGSGTITSIELGGASFTLNGAEEYDRTKLTGSAPAVTFAGTLALSLFGGFTPDDYQAFGIFQLDSGATVNGTFASLGEGALVGTFGGKDLFITYQGDFGDSGPVATFGGNDVVLYSVPEPDITALGLLSTLRLLRRRRR